MAEKAVWCLWFGLSSSWHCNPKIGFDCFWLWLKLWLGCSLTDSFTSVGFNWSFIIYAKLQMRFDRRYAWYHKICQTMRIYWHVSLPQRKLFLTMANKEPSLLAMFRKAWVSQPWNKQNKSPFNSLCSFVPFDHSATLSLWWESLLFNLCAFFFSCSPRCQLIWFISINFLLFYNQIHKYNIFSFLSFF